MLTLPTNWEPPLLLFVSEIERRSDMSTEKAAIQDHGSPGAPDTRWPLGALAGVLAGLIRPLGLALVAAGGISAGLFEMTLQPELPLWQIIHLGYSLVFGALYAAIAYRGLMRPYVDRPSTGALVGGCYGLALWIVNVAVVWNLLHTFVFPTTVGGSLVGPIVGHLVYGVALGVLYPLLRRYA